MIAVSGDRTALIKVFARQITPGAEGALVSSVSELPDAEIVALFHEKAERGELPEAIIVSGVNLREFFAWSATYLAHWSPLTACVRVIPRSTLSESLEVVSNRTRLLPELCRALASITVGEALFEWKLAGEKSVPTLLSLRSTFSYAAAQAILTSQTDIESLFVDWERAIHLLRLGRRRIERTTMLSIWQPIAMSLIGKGESSGNSWEISQLLVQTITEKQLPLNRLTNSGELFGGFELEVRSNRSEDAVIELERWLGKGTHKRSAIDRFFVGCLATRLSRCALTHFDVLARMTDMEPESILWYSFLSGFFALDPSPPRLERVLFRLSNEYSHDYLAPPPDISVDELQVLVQGDGYPEPWVGIGAGYLAVDIRSGVLAYFRLRDHVAASSTSAKVGMGMTNDNQIFEDLLRQLRSLYHRREDQPEKKRRRK